jgi:hypothetical protein
MSTVSGGGTHRCDLAGADQSVVAKAVAGDSRLRQQMRSSATCPVPCVGGRRHLPRSARAVVSLERHIDSKYGLRGLRSA